MNVSVWCLSCGVVVLWKLLLEVDVSIAFNLSVGFPTGFPLNLLSAVYFELCTLTN